MSDRQRGFVLFFWRLSTFFGIFVALGLGFWLLGYWLEL